MARPPKPTRPNPEIIPSPVYTLRVENNDGVTNVPKSFEAYRRTWSGVRTPNFIQFKDKGLLPENSTSSLTIWDENGTALDSRIPTPWNPTKLWSKATGVCKDFWDWRSSPVADHAAMAQVRAVAKLRSKVANSGGLAIDLGEINQTVNMIATNVTRMAHAARAIRRGNLKGAASALGITSSRKFPGGPRGPLREKDPLRLLAAYWLEFTYGWKPLIQDIHESIEALEKFLEKNQWVVAARGKGGVPISFNLKYPRTVGAAFGPTDIGNELHSGESHCKYTVYYKRDDHVKVLLAELGLTNPADLVWELLPFSFVVDWFFPIGPWLEALHTFDGLVFVKGTKVEHTVENVNLEIASSYNGHEPGQWFYDVLQYGSRTGQVVRFNRTPLTGFPAATPPYLKSPISTAHAANALALLTTLFYKR